MLLASEMQSCFLFLIQSTCGALVLLLFAISQGAVNVRMARPQLPATALQHSAVMAGYTKAM